jgi:hypothetical protein
MVHLLHYLETGNETQLKNTKKFIQNQMQSCIDEELLLYIWRYLHAFVHVQINILFMYGFVPDPSQIPNPFSSTS